MKTFRETHKVQLTDEEIRDAGESLAKLTDDIDEKEAAKKAVTSQFKAELDGMTADARKQASLVRNKYEYRLVDCSEAFDYDHSEVSTYRDDTGELLRKRTMTTEEKQAELDLGGEKEPDADTENEEQDDDGLLVR